MWTSLELLFIAGIMSAGTAAWAYHKGFLRGSHLATHTTLDILVDAGLLRKEEFSDYVEKLRDERTAIQASKNQH